MKIRDILGVLMAVLLLASCASAAPNYINGRYYMDGDSACERGSVNKDGNLNCYNSKGEYTESRRPISEMQAKAWYDSINSPSSFGGGGYNPPRQTICNNIAGTVICNSF